MSKTVNIKDLLVPVTQPIRDLRDFLNLHTKCMDQKLNFDINLSKSDKDLVVENEILKVKLEADKENTFLRGEVKDLTVLLNAKIETSSHNFKPNTKEC